MKWTQRGAGILMNYLTEGVKVLSVLLYTPLMLRLLGQQEYGLYQLAASVVSYLGLLNLGFGSGYVRYYSRYQVKGDRVGIARLNGMFLLIFGALSLLCLLCGALLVTNAELVFGEGLTAGEGKKAAALLKILTANLALTLLCSVFDCHIAARERFLFQKLLRLVQTVLSPFLTIPLLLMGFGSEAAAAVTLGLTAVQVLGNAVYCRKRLKMAFSFRNLRFSMLGELWRFTFFIFLNQVIDQVNWNVDKFLLGRMQGTAAVAVYGIGAQIHSLYMQMSTAVSAVFLTKVNRVAARTGDNRELSRLLAQVGRLQAMILMLLLSGFALFGRPFLHLWAGSGYEEAYPVALLLMVPITIPLIQNLGIEIQRARNRHRTRSAVCACLAVGNVLLSVLLIPRWSCIGAAAGTAVSLLFGNVLFINWYYQKRLKLDMGLFWREILSLTPAWIPACLCGAVLAANWRIESWGSLLMAALVYSGVYAAFVCRCVEKQKKKRGQEGSCPRGIKR